MTAPEKSVFRTSPSMISSRPCSIGVAKFLLEIVDQVRVDLNRDHFIGAFQQRFCQRAFARANFDDARHSLAAGGFCDAIQNGFSEEEVLAEAATHEVTSRRKAQNNTRDQSRRDRQHVPSFTVGVRWQYCGSPRYIPTEP